MLLKAPTKSITAVSVTLLIASSLVLADSVKTYEIDGWCLSYEPLQLPEGAEDVTVPGAFPTFLVPIDVPTLSVIDDPQETGVLATFSKGLASEWVYRMSGPSSGTIDCTRRPRLRTMLSYVCNLVCNHRQPTKPC
jgi:hypothetical protein